MTIQGAIYELNNMLSSNDIPFYWKPAIKKIIETVEQTEQDVGMCQQNVGEMSEKQTDGDLISRTDLLKDIAKLKKSPWFNEGKDIKDLFRHNSYVARKEAVEIIEDLCIKKLPSAEKTTLSAEKTTITDGDLISRQAVIDKIRSMDSNDHIDEYTENVIEYFENMPSAEKTDSFIPQEDVAGILNTVESALKGTNYEVVGYDNTDGFLKVLIDMK